ncbi:MAG: NAD(+)/NADH kinase [Clostridiales Family XIII bacterium]|jgi:NAD+ kinase|nr:NAD(+)/NADH kinase [Clostridiales Family XIII bacterium]
MDEIRKVNIFANEEANSRTVKKRLKTKLEKAGFTVPAELDAGAELIVCIGGDGSLLTALAALDFPDIPIVGVNTGHLGFFQELRPGGLDEFIFRYKEKQYVIQELKTVKAEMVTDDGATVAKGLNEIVIRGARSHVTQLNIFIGESFIETFRGDGILVASPAGSTAYNYALGGSIVDPRLDLLQVTPIAPINNSAYRSFTSSLLLPPHLSLNVFPEFSRNTLNKDEDILITADGAERTFSHVRQIHIGFSAERVQLLRFAHYDFWNKVKEKLL